MSRFFTTRHFVLIGKNKISILNPFSSRSSIIKVAFYRLLMLGLLCFLTKVLLQKESSSVVSSPAARIFCIVSTYKHRQNSVAVHVKRTWTKHCDQTLFVSNDAHEELEPVVFQHLNDKWDLLRAHFEYVYRYHFNEGDWFLYANDDNFVVIENLRDMLDSHSPEKLIYFGCKLNQTYMYDRSGIVISRAALKNFVLDAIPNRTICSQQPLSSSATEELGRCLSNINVQAGDSRDHLGYHRFLPLELKNHLGQQLNKSIEEHRNFLELSYYDVVNVPASVHLISSRVEYMPTIYNLYYLAYEVNIFGTPSKAV